MGFRWFLRDLFEVLSLAEIVVYGSCQTGPWVVVASCVDDCKSNSLINSWLPLLLFLSLSPPSLSLFLTANNCTRLIIDEGFGLPALGLLRQRCDSTRLDIWLMWSALGEWRGGVGNWQAGGSEAKLPGGQIIANDRRFNFSSSPAAAAAAAAYF